MNYWGADAGAVPYFFPRHSAVMCVADLGWCAHGRWGGGGPIRPEARMNCPPTFETEESIEMYLRR